MNPKRVIAGIVILGVFLLFYFLFVHTGCKSDVQSPKSQLSTEKKYELFCASCHGKNMEQLISRQWVYGGTPDQVFQSIKYGRPPIGMPGFDEAFTDEEIKALSNYLITELKGKKELPPPATIGKVISSEELFFKIDTLTKEVQIPWGMTFLPGGDMLITERSGKLYRFTKGKELTLIEDLPGILARGQGGLMDVELHPNYQENGWIYIAYSSPATSMELVGNTAITRAKLLGNRLVSKEVIFNAVPNSSRGHHWGCRLEFDNDGYLFFSVGDRGVMSNAQKLDNDCGKIHRIHDDGSIPGDNPFVGQAGARPTIFSYGHRNPQGVAKHPVSGEIWIHEHGPKGGDELNVIKKGRNYGWPTITFGINYNGTIITNDTAKVGMEQPVTYWIPSIAPCGMTFVKGDKFTPWKNNILIGALSHKKLVRCVLENNKVIHQEILLKNIGRVRNVEMGPDGLVYVALEKPGMVLRLSPAE